jgi:dihydrofolate reductase
MSIDGFFEDEEKKLDWFTPDESFFTYARAMLRSVDTILFGRATWEHMAAYWPSAPADEIAEQMNQLPKVVFSKTLPVADWQNSRLVRSDAVEEVQRLKQLPGRDMVILGSAALSSCLLQAGLIDEYRVIVAPVVLGRGTPLFQDVRARIGLRLTDVRRFDSGVVMLSYLGNQAQA